MSQHNVAPPHAQKVTTVKIQRSGITAAAAAQVTALAISDGAGALVWFEAGANQCT
jgi:hypothetical protein